jgi:3,4-dihydroxy-9,10-secoandrosta-1,3,5(10)-triene-9,17-dione 4,5-dioxygenase
MSEVTQLGYLGLGVRDLGQWASYADETLGLERVATDADGAMLLRLDEHFYRFAVHEADEDDITYSGWQVDTASDLAAIGARLEAAGTNVARATKEEAEQRRVLDLIRFKDPDGHDVEVFYGPQMAGSPFLSKKGGTSFVAGNQGLGHFVIAANNLHTTMDFYTSMLGMKVSDYVTRGRLKLGFLHCNPRHHSIAFVEYPNAPKRANHFMLQLDNFDAVGRTWDKVQDGAAPVIMTLGRHSNDHMVSFYMRNPSGFGVEYGWGAREVDDSCWQVAQYDTTSTWGHKPPPKRD